MSRLWEKRLMRDLGKLNRQPLPGISLEPEGDHLQVLHFTIMGPEGSKMEGVPFHGQLEIPANYPNSAPKMFFHTYIPIDPEFTWVPQDDRGFYSPCLNVSSNWESRHEEWEHDQGSGWSPGSGLETPLIHFQSMMFSEIDDSDDSCQKATRQALKYFCSKCGHSGAKADNYRPVISIQLSVMEPPKGIIDEKKSDSDQDSSEDQDSSDDQDSSEGQKPAAEGLKNAELIRRIEEMAEHQQAEEGEIVCYASGERLTSDSEQIFGVGIYKGPHSYLMIIREYLSYQAWSEGIRRSTDKEVLTEWVPLYLSADHWKRATSQVPLLQKFDVNLTLTIEQLFTDGRSALTETEAVIIYQIYSTLIKSGEYLNSDLIPLTGQLKRAHGYGLINTLNKLCNYLAIILTDGDPRITRMILEETIYHNPSHYKARYPEILDLSKPCVDLTSKVCTSILDSMKSLITLNKVVKLVNTWPAEDRFGSLEGDQKKQWLDLWCGGRIPSSLKEVMSELRGIIGGSELDLDRYTHSVLKKKVISEETVNQVMLARKRSGRLRGGNARRRAKRIQKKQNLKTKG